MERQPVYNIYDIYEFTFENHVNPRMTSTETQFSQSLDFFAVTLEGAWSNAKWLECNKKLNQDAAHYVHIGLYLAHDCDLLVAQIRACWKTFSVPYEPRPVVKLASGPSQLHCVVNHRALWILLPAGSSPSYQAPGA